MRNRFSKLRHSAAGVTGTAVYLTYTLVKTNDVSFADLSIGHTAINLAKDQDPADPNTFKTTKPNQYLVLWEGDGILITVFADGKAGGNWSLTISLNGTALVSNPITESTGPLGRLDHNQKHK
jgi:hypothetical protein